MNAIGYAARLYPWSIWKFFPEDKNWVLVWRGRRHTEALERLAVLIRFGQSEEQYEVRYDYFSKQTH